MQGKTIQNFTLLHLLGEGGLAEVWYAENQIGVKSAVKILKDEFSHNKDVIERFENEARVMVKLSHPHIRKVIDYATIDARPAILMEYLEGEDLSQKLTRGNRYTDQDLIRWWDAAVAALRYTHAQGVIHRDIKPSNLFITKEGELKLLDFGISKVGDNLTATKTGTVMGTPLYMSPEQVRDSKNIDYRSDLYSLAVSFFQLLTRQKPYGIEEEDSLFDTQRKIVDIAVNTSILPSPWESLLNPLLEKKAEMRSNPLLSSELKNDNTVVDPTPAPFAGGGTVIDPVSPVPAAPRSPVPPIPTPGLPAPPQPKKKTTTWIIAALSVVFLVLLTVFFLRNSTPDSPNPNPEPIVINPDSIIKAESARAEVLVASDIDKAIDIYAELAKKYPENKELRKRKKKLEKKKVFDSIKWVQIPAGNFIMGSPKEEAWENGKGIQHKVSLSAFKMSKYEITFDQYDDFCRATGRTKPSDEGWGRGRRPVINVNWHDAKSFADWLGGDVRLPTEAEWEYACRAETTTPFNTGYDLTIDQANYDDLSSYDSNTEEGARRKTMPVGSYNPNAWGLCDMHGNVGEWCSDWSGDYLDSVQRNPQGPSIGSYRILRGGDFLAFSHFCRSDFRNVMIPEKKRNRVGFRLVYSN